MGVLVIDNRYLIIVVIPNDVYELFDVIPHHPKVNVIVPRNEALISHRAKKCAEHHPIVGAIRLAQRVKLTEQLGTSKLEQPHAACSLGKRTEETLLGILQRLAPLR